MSQYVSAKQSLAEIIAATDTDPLKDHPNHLLDRRYAADLVEAHRAQNELSNSASVHFKPTS